MVDITPILQAVLSLIGVAVSVYIAPALRAWLKERVTDVQQTTLAAWVRVAVEAAEQTIKEQGSGKDKKQYVIDFLHERGMSVDDKALDAMIESTVFQIKQIAG